MKTTHEPTIHRRAHATALRARRVPGRVRGALRLRARSLGRLALAVCLLASPRPVAAWSDEDEALARFLIRDLRYHDTATRFLALQERRSPSEAERARIEALKIDLLLAQGKEAEAKEAQARYEKQFPNAARAQVGRLDLISLAMGKVAALFDKALLTPDPKAAADLRAQAKRVFAEEVEKPLDALIASQSAQIDKLKTEAAAKRDPKAKPDPSAQRPWDLLVQTRDQAELSRLKSFLVYSRRLDADSPERKELLEKGLAMADKFVNERYEYFVMQYEGQLQRGIFAYELGKHGTAEEHLGVLYSIEPPGEPPFPKALIVAFKHLRLQAVLFGARAIVAAGQSSRAVSMLEANFVQSRGTFGLSNAEDDPQLRQFAVLTRLQYGIALADTGKVVEGLEQIQQVIRRYSSAGIAGGAQELVNEARKALGELAVRGVALRGEDYYEAAIGLKSALRFDDAVATFQRALGAVDPSKARDRAVMARCLNEIGEISFILKRYEESALAYQEVYRYLQEAEPALVPKIAKNFLAASTRAADTRRQETKEDHSGIKKLVEEATKFNEKRGGGGAIQELNMTDAQQLEQEGKFDAARETYFKVQKEVDGEKIPFYWRAQASGHACTYRLWDAADAAGKQGLRPDLDKAIAALEEIPPKAIPDGDKSGAATAVLTLGQIYFALEEYPKAVQILGYFAPGRELASEAAYKCLGLGYLVLAHARSGGCEEAKPLFNVLYKDKECRDDQVFAYAAQALSDGFYDAGDPKSSAVYLLVYINTSVKTDELKKDPPRLFSVIKRLIEGERYKDSERFVKLFEEVGAANPDLQRQLLILNALRLEKQGKLDEAIEVRERYAKEFEDRGANEDDPYNRRELAELYLKREARPQFKDYEKADLHYRVALGMMKNRVDADKSLEKTFFRWMLRFCELKLRIGDAGQPAAYGDVIQTVEIYKHGDMGGLKDEFLKLLDEATRKQKGGKASGAGKSAGSRTSKTGKAKTK